ncbi:PREDICTED: testis-expressed sequence 12 protein isoform X2 [Hipposideros armiger]|uniref:Testis-expressed sequence 12 protein isoform X2 n=1 Tax=Hipposideros armiger TaxID=186990 RepID=A0A8B7S7A6_HIPAR|nr:PREDICTED: testis-expressed sequence 12 protein isoform X2 [Hipposideros armiger]
MMENHLIKPDTRNCKRSRELEPQMPDSPQLSSLGKSDSSFSESSGLFYKDEALEKDLNAMSKDINLMMSSYAKILRKERTAWRGRLSCSRLFIWKMVGQDLKARILEPGRAWTHTLKHYTMLLFKGSST